MFIKCNCVDRLAGNEKKPPLCFKDLHKGQSLRDIQFSGHIGESRILSVTPPFQKAKEKPVTANVQLTGLLIPSAPSNLPV